MSLAKNLALLLVLSWFSITPLQAAWKLPVHQFNAQGGGMGIASDAKGNAIAVLDNKGKIEAFAYSKITGQWSKKANLDIVDNYAEIELAMRPNGSAIAVWATKVSTGTALYSSFFDGTKWTTAHVPFAVDSSIRNFTLKMNDSNAALVTWLNGASVYASFFNDGTWSTPVPIAHSDGFQLSTAYSVNGTAVVGFVEGRLGKVINYKDGFWGQPTTLEYSPHLCNHNIVVGMDDKGRALVAWMSAHPWTMWAKRFDGSAWLSAEAISGPYHSNLCHGNSLGMTPDGKAVFVWTGDDLDGSHWQGFSNSFDGIHWSTPQKFSDDAFRTSLSLNSKGDALLLFYNPISEIATTKLPFGDKWSKSETLNNTSLKATGTYHLGLFSSLSDTGDAFVGWLRGFDYASNYFVTYEEA